ncbi:hypothetical protein ACIQW5_05015 [Methylorubrum thiocyanatum]|uniref:phosphoribosyltransferase-like protein n=1 Tax=Methylorubrum thiocyanatum TaxID=47958 RepID=UPI00383B7922
MKSYDSLQETERLIKDYATSQSPDEARFAVLSAVKTTLSEIGGGEKSLPTSLSIADMAEEASSISSGGRDIAFYLVRCLGVPSLINEGDQGTVGLQFARKLISLIEQRAPDVSAYLKLSEQKMPAGKLEILRDAHRYFTDQIELFQNMPTDPVEFASRRQEIFRIIKGKFLNSYLNLYGFIDFSNSVRGIMNATCEMLETTDANFGQNLQGLFERVDNDIRDNQGRQDFLAITAWLPFLRSARAVLVQIESEASERFRCILRPRRAAPYVIECNYPLHEANRVVRVKIPLVNDGPGLAIDTNAQIVSGADNAFIGSDIIDLGTVPPGEFSVSFDLLVGDQITSLPIFVELSWRTVRGSDRQVASFDAIVSAQKPDINWEELENSDPYSTEVAQGDEFVGRRKKVLALANRLLKQKMQSSYITGQKRVGKTSLAFAMKDHLRRITDNSVESKIDQETEVVYLEYGDYARKDADSTVEALGSAISLRLVRHLPDNIRPSTLDFKGSLAPLNLIAQLLLETEPSRRFVIVLDEFDEIHPEMYRFGALAEAFFSNLRTLSAKSNIAVVLVGGENMPFIIGAQGDQLNKFVREPLDYFSRSDEWDDFVELAKQARQPETAPLNWHDSALNELFNFTNGHPYYTKLICARVFQNAVSDRDAEVTVDEIQRAVTALVEQLDINSFAHFWKDGIPHTREESEVIELKRCRLLVAVARTSRQGEPLNADRIAQNKGTTALSNSDVTPILGDFCRREILREKGREYEFVLPVFQEWLVHKGINKLITDTLGDELADQLQKSEDAAYVTAPEVALLVDSWPLYRGRRITSEDVRSWLSQRPSFREQRLLFNILKNLRFVSEEEVREKLRTAHSIVKKHTTAFTPENRSQRRYDIMVTYVDGPAKSGSRYADKYAEENLISSTCVIEPELFAKRAVEHESKRNVTINGVVIVDDIAATGQSLADNVSEFLDNHAVFLSERNITVVIVTMLATRQADEKIRETLSMKNYKNVDLRVCEFLTGASFAFGEGLGIWESEDQKDHAKSVVLELGSKISKHDPFGYGGLGLLVTFYDTCPNNTLPIIHSSGAGGWQPLIIRPKN